MGCRVGAVHSAWSVWLTSGRLFLGRWRQWLAGAVSVGWLSGARALVDAGAFWMS
jgi:hypothetical protein